MSGYVWIYLDLSHLDPKPRADPTTVDGDGYQLRHLPLGQSGRPLSGKRCPADSCKKEYQRRWKAAKSVGEEPHLQTVPVRDGSGSPSTLPALSPKSAAAEPLSSFVLWDSGSAYLFTGSANTISTSSPRTSCATALLRIESESLRTSCTRIGRKATMTSAGEPPVPATPFALICCNPTLAHGPSPLYPCQLSPLPTVPWSCRALTRHTSSLHTAPLPLRWVNGWVTLQAIVKALSDSELSALDDYQESNPSPIFKEERARLRAQETEDEDKT